MKSHEVDITETLFPTEKLTPEEERIENRKWYLHSLAAEETTKKIEGQAPFSPLKFLRESNRIYKAYLREEGLKYDSIRGF